MRITLESDYAIRIMYNLCKAGPDKHVGASALAVQSGITQRFALKILRKLVLCGILTSYKGSSGGYSICRSPEDIKIGEIIEAIDGPIAINHCIDSSFCCTRVSDKSCCGFHNMFDKLNSQIRSDLYSITFADFIE